jgi:hypothetical protein
MKTFLLIYDRGAGRLVRVDEFEESHRGDALRARYEAEIAAIQDARDEEIVIFEAESLDALKRTHGSYFSTVRELGERLRRLASGQAA